MMKTDPIILAGEIRPNKIDEARQGTLIQISDDPDIVEARFVRGAQANERRRSVR